MERCNDVNIAVLPKLIYKFTENFFSEIDKLILKLCENAKDVE